MVIQFTVHEGKEKRDKEKKRADSRVEKRDEGNIPYSLSFVCDDDLLLKFIQNIKNEDFSDWL